jgi:hypothetical protein
MNEAVEIAKLRLFLKLVATVDADYSRDNLGLEPLPDVDFNIRSGNTLVGYAAKKQIYDIIGLFVTDAHKKKILEQCDIVARAFARYKEIQLSSGDDYDGFRKAKDDLNERLKKLTDDLDGILYMEQYEGFSLEGEDYKKWLVTHQPFHWFAEFYEIIHGKGGFDVVIGNPPYVEYGDVRDLYLIKDYVTENCGNLFAYTIERAYSLLEGNGCFGFIVPISSVCTPRMKSLFNFERRNSKQLFVSNYAVRPDKLFSGADMNLTIHIAKRTKTNDNCNVFSTNYLRWYTDFRNQLFPTLCYGNGILRPDGLIYKIQSTVELKIMKTLLNLKQITLSPIDNNTCIYYHSGGRYFRKCILEKLSNEYKPLPIPEKNKYQMISLFSSSLYFWYWVSFSDTYHVTKPDIDSFRYPEKIYNDKGLLNLGERLIDDLDSNRKIRDRQRKDGSIQKEVNYVVSKSKPIIDQIDCLLAQHYGFTHEELDFIINYDIKYRMGKELENEEN